MTTVSAGSCGDEPRGLPVRQREHDHVVPGEHVDGGRLEHAVRQRPQVRVVLAQRRAGTGPRGQRADRQLRVAQGQPQHLTPGVPAGTRDSHTHHAA